MSNLKTVVRGAYDIQKLRIQMGNRIVGNFKAKLGQEPGEKESKLDTEGKQILNNLRVHYRKITDGVKTFPRQKSFNGDEVISSYTELCLLAQYVDLETHESQHFRRLGSILNEYPIWTEFLESVKGVGPAMGGVIISEIDISAATYPSSLWAYAGLDVASNGAGRSRKKEHLVERQYIDKDGNDATRVGITFNPFLKTKLVGVLASSFLRAGDNEYSKVYYNYKHRIENHDAHKEKPARVGIATVCELDNSDDCFNAVETTQKVIARVGPTAGVDIEDIVTSLTPSVGKERAMIKAHDIMAIIGAAAPKINGDL